MQQLSVAGQKKKESCNRYMDILANCSSSNKSCTNKLNVLEHLCYLPNLLTSPVKKNNCGAKLYRTLMIE